MNAALSAPALPSTPLARSQPAKPNASDLRLRQVVEQVLRHARAAGLLSFRCCQDPARLLPNDLPPYRQQLAALERSLATAPALPSDADVLAWLLALRQLATSSPQNSHAAQTLHLSLAQLR